MVFNYDQKRKEYLTGNLSHEEFYLEYADAIAFDDLQSLVPEIACKSRDPHLNDVPLKVWDHRFAAVRMLLTRAINQGRVVKRVRGLSVAESCCILKAVAKEINNELMYV
ncbi:hypothetical protein [Enterococcus sp. DIV0187]|uniref:hypothetical protein n=1 Tax=Enterococcus sp. DIV0187 TaxID=2774644 RepID=UPI003F1F3506